MKKYFIVLLLMTLVVGESLAQKLSHIGQYYLIPHTLNPAFTGIEDYLDLKGGYRFTTLPNELSLGALPSNYFVAANYSIHAGEIGNPGFKALRISNPSQLPGLDETRTARHGIGLTFARRELGVYENTVALASYAFHLPIANKWTAALGVSGGFTQGVVNPGNIVVIDGSDPIFQSLTTAGTNSTFDLNAGLTLFSQNLYVGYAMNQLTSGTIQSVSIPDSANVRYITHTTQAGFQFRPRQDYQVQFSGVVNIRPDLGVTYVAAAKMVYQELITLGLGYRSEGSITGYLGLVLGAQITVGYAYDYAVGSGLRDYTTGSHELVLGYRLMNPYFKPTRFW